MLHKNKQKNKYIAQFRRGKIRKEKVCSTLKAAKKWEADMRKLSDEELNGTTTGITSLLEFSQIYLDHAESLFAKKTYQEKRSMFKRFFKHVDPTLSVTELTSAMVMDYLLKQKEQRSGYSANKDRKNLISSWNYGMKYLNPMLPSPNPCKVRKLPEVRSPRYVPPVVDFWKVYNMLPVGQDQVMLLTFLHTAGRRGEIFRLTVSDIDFQNSRIRLSTKKRKGGLEHDWLPLTTELKGELSWWLEQRPPDLKNKPYVFMCLEKRPFHFKHYGEPFRYRSKFMKSVCLKAGVKPFGYHAIRHLASSLLFSMGYGVGTIQVLLRHQNPNATAKYLKTQGIEHIKDAVEGLTAMGNMSASGDDRQECRH